MAEGGNDQIKSAIHRRTQWYRRFVFWRLVSWGLTTVIAGGSAFVASSLSNHGYAREIIALIIATFAAIQAALSPAVKAASFRQAWVILDLALQEFSGLPPALVKAISEGEHQIDQTHIVGQSPPVG